MNQPHDPNNRYDDSPFFVYVPQQGYPRQDGAPGQYGYRPPEAAGAGYRSANPYGRAHPPKSRLPIYLAGGLVLVLAVGVTLFVGLRDGGGQKLDGPSAVDVTKAFLKAVDDRDGPALKEMSRGDVLDDIDDIVSLEDYEVVFSSGNLLHDAEKEVGDVEIAVVLWQVVDVPEDLASEEDTLAVSLLDEGDGYQICYVDDAAGKSITTLMAEWQDDFAQSCDYSK